MLEQVARRLLEQADKRRVARLDAVLDRPREQQARAVGRRRVHGEARAQHVDGLGAAAAQLIAAHVGQHLVGDAARRRAAAARLLLLLV